MGASKNRPSSRPVVTWPSAGDPRRARSRAGGTRPGSASGTSYARGRGTVRSARHAPAALRSPRCARICATYARPCARPTGTQGVRDGRDGLAAGRTVAVPVGSGKSEHRPHVRLLEGGGHRLASERAAPARSEGCAPSTAHVGAAAGAMPYRSRAEGPGHDPCDLLLCRFRDSKTPRPARRGRRPRGGEGRGCGEAERPRLRAGRRESGRGLRGAGVERGASPRGIGKPRP
jgi:hypothetical protein